MASESKLTYRQLQLLEFLKSKPDCAATYDEILQFGHSPRAATALESKGYVIIDKRRVKLLDLFP